MFLSIFALLANYTAYSVFNALSAQNAPIILRSSIGQFASQMSSNLVALSLDTLLFVAGMSYLEIARPGAVGFTFGCIFAVVFVPTDA